MRKRSSTGSGVAPRRLSALVERSDVGFLARSPELNTLGYGEHVGEAILDLAESVKDYLSVLREEESRPAPEIVHHLAYLPLLEEPAVSWFASVELQGVDASDLE